VLYFNPQMLVDQRAIAQRQREEIEAFVRDLNARLHHTFGPCGGGQGATSRLGAGERRRPLRRCGSGIGGEGVRDTGSRRTHSNVFLTSRLSW